MTALLRPIDMHTHIDPTIHPDEITRLHALVFVATRSLDESAAALTRRDTWAIWGVGCHPKLARAQRDFDPDQFRGLAVQTPYVSEIGLDGSSRVPLPTQQATFAAILRHLTETPRIASIHSYAATTEVLDALEAQPVHGAVLHWWLGDRQQTQRAVDLGCRFSINAAMLRRRDILETLPLDRLLTETDHPHGDRSVGRTRRPGITSSVETALANHHNLAASVLRQQLWRNLAELVSQSRCGSQFPGPVRAALAAT